MKRIKLRSNSTVYLIGNIERDILGSKLPTNRQVLSVYFFNLRELHLNRANSARDAIRKVIVFWERARIPTSSINWSTKKLLQLYDKWRAVSKHTEHQKEKETAFSTTLDQLFDIADVNALDIMKIEEDKQFLLAQRKKGREGCLMGIDTKGEQKEREREQRIELETKRKDKAKTKAEIEKQIYASGNLVQFLIESCDEIITLNHVI